MANDYYTHASFAVERGATARADDINNIGQSIEAGLNKLPAELVIKRGLVNYGTESGAADAYAVTMPFTDTAYTDGYLVTFAPSATNTGASTVDVDGLGAKSILKADGSALSAGDIASGKTVSLRYNAAADCFYLHSSSPADVTAASAASSSASAAAASAAAASSSESAAEAYADIAASSADYQGAWSAGTYTIGQTVSHNSGYWIVAVASTNDEPSSSSADWFLIKSSGASIKSAPLHFLTNR